MLSKQRSVPYVIVLPVYLLVLAFVAYPIFEIVRISFTSWHFLRPDSEQFVGFPTYVDVLTAPIFGQIMGNTLLCMLMGTAFSLVLGTAIGYFLSFDFPINRILRAVIIVPWVLPPVVTASIWGWMLHGQFGVFNDLLLRSGVLSEGYPFLGRPNTAFVSVNMILVWKNVPLISLLLSAAFQGVPKELTEAGIVDGANAWTRFWRIVFPSVKSTFLAVAVIVNIWAIQQFVLIWMTTQGGPVNATHILPTYIFQMFTQSYHFGKLGVLSVFNVALLLVIVAIYLRVFRSEE